MEYDGRDHLVVDLDSEIASHQPTAKRDFERVRKALPNGITIIINAFELRLFIIFVLTEKKIKHC